MEEPGELIDAVVLGIVDLRAELKEGGHVVHGDKAGSLRYFGETAG